MTGWSILVKKITKNITVIKKVFYILDDIDNQYQDFVKLVENKIKIENVGLKKNWKYFFNKYFLISIINFVFILILI